MYTNVYVHACEWCTRVFAEMYTTKDEQWFRNQKHFFLFIHEHNRVHYIRYFKNSLFFDINNYKKTDKFTDKSTKKQTT